MSTHRSFSQVKTLRSCGEMFRLERVERVAQRPSTAALAGRTVHQATELVDYEIASGETDAQALFYGATRLASEILDQEIEAAKTPEFPNPDEWRSFGASKNNPAGQDLAWFRKTGNPASIQHYIDWRLNAVPHYDLMVLPSGELAIEVEFSVKLGETEVLGAIDRVFVDTKHGFSVIVDIKNGTKPKTTEQLGVYRHAMNEQHPDGGPYLGSYLYGLKPTSRSETKQSFPNALTSWTPERLTALYSDADQQIKASIFLPNPGEACFMCSVTQHCAFYSASQF